MKPEDVIKAQNPVCVLYANDEEQCQHAKKRRDLQSKAPSQSGKSERGNRKQRKK